MHVYYIVFIERYCIVLYWRYLSTKANCRELIVSVMSAKLNCHERILFCLGTNWCLSYMTQKLKISGGGH